MRACAPGTLIADDSAPHCFDVEQAFQRAEEHADILFTEAGVLHSPYPIRTVFHFPGGMEAAMSEENLTASATLLHSYRIFGCMFSSLLSTIPGFEHLEPTVGMIPAEVSAQHYRALVDLGFRGANLHCNGRDLPEGVVEEFRLRRFEGIGGNSSA
uniref:Uncharacterized protein n=1 Tax=Candidatus Kentrum sp. FM TaxID=2126340 RepID=A0A450S9U4_9GAMM|nr:MAG: hypothetical protein BECKFM1743A_GA0114220_1005511 [Candidatus Kentron sp. FM]VFJ48775.1 MAG: hypothetical protein BECKFM1743C_GA0114222_1006311 [Candidatus Kentron sp. FM]VFK09433.1 MAG: hypothetical protein BECKFM1743B_GA0114221_101052 [Candidatus Kentron sp. FM]